MHKFNIVRASFTEIMNFGVSIDTVLCSIIDPQGIPDELFYATFRYCSDILCLPSVVIMKSGWSSSFICSLEFSYTPFLLSIGDRFPHEMIKVLKTAVRVFVRRLFFPGLCCLLKANCLNSIRRSGLHLRRIILFF